MFKLEENRNGTFEEINSDVSLDDLIDQVLDDNPELRIVELEKDENQPTFTDEDGNEFVLGPNETIVVLFVEDDEEISDEEFIDMFYANEIVPNFIIKEIEDYV